MHARSLAVVLFSVFAATAAAGPHKDSPFGAAAAKPSKKQVEIEKHEWLAEFYVLKQNDLKSAAKEYQAILTLDPGNDHATMALASLYMRDGKQKQAIDIVAKLTKKSPKSTDAWLALAQLQAQAKDDKGAKASLDKAIAIDFSG